jgi:hypothetical protein
MVKLPVTDDATPNETVPVAALPALHDPDALVEGCVRIKVTSSVTVTPAVTYSNVPVQVPETLNAAVGEVGVLVPPQPAVASPTLAITTTASRRAIIV